MMKTIRNNKAMTIIELIIVIAIMGIISAFSVIAVGYMLTTAKQKGDETVIASLNEASNLLRYSNTSNEFDTFEAFSSDSERLDYLFDEGLITSYPEPLIDTNSFVYDDTLQLWVLNGSGGSVTYSETDASAFTVSGTKITSYDTSSGLSVVIPSKIDGTTITEIGQDCFKDDGITAVIIQEGITRISGNAFHTNNLTSVTIPNSVTRIWHNAFNGNQITSVSFGSGVTRIDGGAFSNNSITSVTLPSSVTFVGSGAFGYGDNYITSITIGANVTIENTASFGWYGSAFKSLYDENQEAGTYTFSGGTWTKQ